MSLGHPIQLRLTQEKQLYYEKLAELHNIPLATYMREKLETDIDLKQEILGLRQDLTMIQNAVAQLPQTTDKALMIEILLLLRSLTGPDILKIVHSEMKRNGIERWQI